MTSKGIPTFIFLAEEYSASVLKFAYKRLFRSYLDFWRFIWHPENYPEESIFIVTPPATMLFWYIRSTIGYIPEGSLIKAIYIVCPREQLFSEDLTKKMLECVPPHLKEVTHVVASISDLNTSVEKLLS